MHGGIHKCHKPKNKNERQAEEFHGFEPRKAVFAMLDFFWWRMGERETESRQKQRSDSSNNKSPNSRTLQRLTREAVPKHGSEPIHQSLRICCFDFVPVDQNKSE